MGRVVRSELGHLISKYILKPDPSGIFEYTRIPPDDDTSKADEEVWYAYLEGNPPSGWYNDQTYVDTLSEKAIRRFIEVTHERYAEAVGKEFGGLCRVSFVMSRNSIRR